ncbi:MAG: hypothetical protein WC699_02840 [Bacteroidales bacterium]
MLIYHLSLRKTHFCGYEKLCAHGNCRIHCPRHLTADVREKGQRTFKQLTIDSRPFDFSAGFTDLHTKSYEEILAGRGFGIAEARPAIELVHGIRKTVRG